MKLVDLTGQRFGRLTVLGRRFHTRRVAWNCACDCGCERVVTSTHLRTGHTKSCGCIASEATVKRNVENGKHGMWKSPEFGVWAAMLHRCNNPKNPKYAIYGGRGIKVCPEWAASFAKFFEHVGPRPSALHSIDRINGERGYEPGNVRWATLEEQNNNRSNNVRAVIDGEDMTAAQIARRYGLKHRTVSYRISKGWVGADLTQPSRRA